MPYEWTKTSEEAPDNSGASLFEAGDPPFATLRLWPNKSLSKDGFVWFIVPTVVLLCIPLFAVLGTPILWILLFYAALAVGGVWFAIMSHHRAELVSEELKIWRDRLELTHTKRGTAPLHWIGNPYWVRVDIHSEGGPVENYLTLKGGDRVVELGAFLSPFEREDLMQDVLNELAACKSPKGG